MDWNGHCQRCGKETSGFTMSWFNTDLVCFDCKDKETKDPNYKAAREAEERAVRNGNLNFPGIFVRPGRNTAVEKE